MPKTEMEIEKLLQWAWRDELSKRHTSAAEGIWDRIQEDAQRGGVDKGHGAAQRYAHFGLPDPDAERIESAVGALDDLVMDWRQSFGTIAGDLSALITVNDLVREREPARAAKAGWGKAGDRALRGMFGPGSERPAPGGPRDVLMVATVSAAALVTMHAVQGTRPDWQDDDPEPQRVPAARGDGPMIDGECRGKNLYSNGASCPLKYVPSPLSIVLSRADYAVWHNALCRLTETLDLEKFTPLPPKASATPWIDGKEETPTVLPVLPNGRNRVKDWGTLPLTPSRRRFAGYQRVDT